MIFELYYSKTGNDYSYISRDENYEIKINLLEGDAQKIWEYDAKSYFEAMQAYHDYQGWGRYVPVPGVPDTTYI